MSTRRVMFRLRVYFSMENRGCDGILVRGNARVREVRRQELLQGARLGTGFFSHVSVANSIGGSIAGRQHHATSILNLSEVLRTLCVRLYWTGEHTKINHFASAWYLVGRIASIRPVMPLHSSRINMATSRSVRRQSNQSPHPQL